jgi:molybdenum ABC transporter molybdate-binding protein
MIPTFAMRSRCSSRPWPFASPAVFAANVTVFAAASLKDALDAQAKAFEAATGNKVIVSYGASNALAKQIEAAAPADVFISADLDWMDYVGQRKLIAAETRFNLLHNTLVLIAPSSSPASLKIGPNFALAAALRNDKLAMANPDSVPAGKYAKSALEKLGAWSSVEKQLARTEERSHRAHARVARRGALRHRLQDGRARRQGREDRRYVPAGQLSPYRLCGGRRRFEQIGVRPAVSRIPAQQARRDRLGKDTGSGSPHVSDVRA